METDNLHFTIPLGTEKAPGETSVSLLPTNGIAEKVFVSKSPSRPYSWIAEVLTIAIAKLGDNNVGVAARKEQEQSGDFTIPECIKDLSLAEANTLLVEVHRRVWEDEIPNQEVNCKFCGNVAIFNINLNKAKYSEEHAKILESYDHILRVSLKIGWEFKALTRMGSNETSYDEWDGIVFNHFELRPPTLRDAIRFQEDVDDSITFWRNLAASCLTRIARVEPSVDGKDPVESSELPTEVIKFYGIKMFNEVLQGKDLKLIRTAIREKIPTLPFTYKDECPCPQRRQIPVAFEPSSFFGE